MKKTISLFIAGAIAVSMMPAAMAVDMESGVTLEQDRSFSKVAPYGATFSSAGAQVLNSYFTVSGNTYLDSAWTDYSRLYDGERYEGHYAGWLNFSDSGTDYTFTANDNAAFDVSGIVLYARNIRGNWEDVSGYRVYLTDTSGNSHYVYDMNYLASDTYAVKITIPASVGAITGVGIDPYTKAEFSEKIKSGYTSDRVVCFDEFVIYGVPHNAPQATITKGSSFADYQSYASSFESIGGAKLNSYFTVSGDNTAVSGGTAPGKYEAFYDGAQYEGANLWGSSDRSVDYVWTANEALDVYGIALYTFEQGSWAARYSDSVSLYRIYVIDENGGKHYVYDMNERATSEYALKIEIPDAYGAITAVGIDPYTTSEIAAKGYEQNDQAIRMCEFVIYGEDPSVPKPVITKGLDFSAYQSYASSFEEAGGAKLNSYFIVSGDNTAVSGGTAPGKYEAFYDGAQYEGANLWGSLNRSVDYVWTAAEALDVDGIALYTFEQGSWAARYSDSVSLYRIYVIDENGGKHYVYDMNERATSEYALKIEIPDAYGAITAVGIDPYTTSEIAAKGYEQNDQAIRMCEFVIYGTAPNTPEEPEPEFFEMTKTGDAVKNADGTSNVGFTTDAVKLSDYKAIAFKLVKFAGGADIKGINLANTGLPYTGDSEVILGVQLDNIGAEYDADQSAMKLVSIEVE